MKRYPTYSGPPAPTIQPMAVPGEGRSPSVPQIKPMAGPGPLSHPTQGGRLSPKQFVNQQGGFKGLASRALDAQQTARVFSGQGGIGRALRYSLTGDILGSNARRLYQEEATQKMSQIHGGVDAD